MILVKIWAVNIYLLALMDKSEGFVNVNQSKFICDDQNLPDQTIYSNLQFNTGISYTKFQAEEHPDSTRIHREGGQLTTSQHNCI